MHRMDVGIERQSGAESAAAETAAPSESVKRRVLLCTILGSGLVFLDSSIAGVALPAIQRELGISTSQQQWVVSGYLLTLSVLLLVGGRLADLYGRKRMFMIGLWSYAVLAASAGIAPNGGTLIALRSLQGVAGALLVPTTLALINATFPAEERGKAIGTWAAWSGISTIFGPILGGLAIDHLSWRFAFLITPPLALLAILMSRPIRESNDGSASPRLDFVGAGLLVLALGGVVFALIQAPNIGWGHPVIIASALVGAALLPAFMWWEKRAASPVMPYAMFSNHNLAVANVVTFFVYAGLYGSTFFIPLYIQTALGVSATLASAVFVPITILLFLLSPTAGRLNDRYGPRWLMFAGPLIAATGLLVAGFTRAGQVWTVLLPGLLLFGVGLGFTGVPVTATAIGSAEERFSGVASGFNNGVSRIAGLLAIAVMGVIVIQLWQGALGSASQDAPQAIAAALETVNDKAFVAPSDESLIVEELKTAEKIADDASAKAYLNGMLLAAALVATGGVVSAAWIRSPENSRDEPTGA